MKQLSNYTSPSVGGSEQIRPLCRPSVADYMMTQPFGRSIPVTTLKKCDGYQTQNPQLPMRKSHPYQRYRNVGKTARHHTMF